MNTVILRDSDRVHDYTAVPIGTPVEGYRPTVACPRCGKGAIVLSEDYDVDVAQDNVTVGPLVHMELAHRREKYSGSHAGGWETWPWWRCEWTAEASS